MTITESVERMKTIQDYILNFIEHGYDIEENYEKINKFINESKILSNEHEFKMLVHLIASIIANHNRLPSFFEKFEQILNLIKDPILKYFTSNEIREIFKTNKRILLFLKKENFIKIGQIDLMQKIPDNYDEMAKKNENEDYVCELIRKDSIEDFIIFVNKNDYSLNNTIKQSVNETNSFLIKRLFVKLIEYASFFGSTQIFKYLIANGAVATPSIWEFGVHSDNPELISLFEENKIIPNDNSYIECYAESIKCHHNQMANYIQSNFLKEGDEKSNKATEAIYESFNFYYFEESFTNPSAIFYLIKYDYLYFIELLSSNINIDVNNLVEVLIIYDIL